jgi:hypothetical protein
MMLKAAFAALFAAAPGALALRYPSENEKQVFRAALIKELELEKPSKWGKLAEDHVRH